MRTSNSLTFQEIHLKKFVLTLSEDQAQALSFASELVSRLYMGQLDSIRVFNRSKDNYDEIDRILKELRLAMGLIPTIEGSLCPNAYWGIRSPEIKDRARTLFDIHQVIRHHLWKELPSPPSYIVDSSPAFQTDHTQPLPEMNKI